MNLPTQNSPDLLPEFESLQTKHTNEQITTATSSKAHLPQRDDRKDDVGPVREITHSAGSFPKNLGIVIDSLYSKE